MADVTKTLKNSFNSQKVELIKHLSPIEKDCIRFIAIESDRIKESASTYLPTVKIVILSQL